jgi:RNA polymerase sigma factor (sigma-70 family)
MWPIPRQKRWAEVREIGHIRINYSAVILRRPALRAFLRKVIILRAINGIGYFAMKPRLAIASGSRSSAQGAAKVKRWARSLAGPSAQLEDLVHDIFLIALRKGFQFRGEAPVETWPFGIAQRVVWTKVRKNRLRQWLFGQNQTMLPPERRTPQHVLERREQSARLYQALDRLPDAYRTALILYELEELRGEEGARPGVTAEPCGCDSIGVANA